MRALRIDTNNIIKRYAQKDTLANKLAFKWLKLLARQLLLLKIFLSVMCSNNRHAAQDFQSIVDLIVYNKEALPHTKPMSLLYIAANAATLYEKLTGIKVTLSDSD